MGCNMGNEIPTDQTTYDATLSGPAWECLDTIREMWYSGTFALLALGQAELLRSAIRQIAPNIQGDWLRTTSFGQPLSISISPEAIARYTPHMHEFVAFGTATRMAGAYEAYVCGLADVAEASDQAGMRAFRSAYRRDSSHSGFNYVHPDVDRGIAVLTHLSGGTYAAPAPYAPCLKFLYALRNVNVHANGIATQWLVDLSQSEHVQVTGPLAPGTPVPWRVEWAVQLEHLLVELLATADPYVAASLALETETRRSWWPNPNEE